MKKSRLFMILFSIIIFNSCVSIPTEPYYTNEQLGYVTNEDAFKEWNYILRDSGKTKIAVLPFVNDEVQIKMQQGYKIGSNKIYVQSKIVDSFDLFATNMTIHNLWRKNQLDISPKSNVIESLLSNKLRIHELNSNPSTYSLELKAKLESVAKDLKVDFLVIGATRENISYSNVATDVLMNEVYNNSEQYGLAGYRLLVYDVATNKFIVDHSNRFITQTSRYTRSDVSPLLRFFLGFYVYTIPKDNINKEVMMEGPFTDFYLTTPMLSESQLEAKEKAEIASGLASSLANFALDMAANQVANNADSKSDVDAAVALYNTDLVFNFDWYEEDETWKSYPADYFIKNYGYDKKDLESIN